jgi:hypothetical protein
MPEIGQMISYFKIVEKTGQVGKGDAFLADDLSRECKVALKFLPDVLTGDSGKIARSER